MFTGNSIPFWKKCSWILILLLTLALTLGSQPNLAETKVKEKTKIKAKLKTKKKAMVKSKAKAKPPVSATKTEKPVTAAKTPPTALNIGKTTTYKIYLTQKGDTLQLIAKKPEWYNDPLKWTMIYALNMEELKKFGIPAGDIPSWSLPEGTALAIMMPKQSQVPMDPSLKWVINLLSSQDLDDITPITIRLLDNGQLAYITEWTIDGKNWKRLRVGFYSDEESARADALRLLPGTGLSNFWLTEATSRELEEYAMFFE